MEDGAALLSAMPLAPNTRLGRYEIRSLIGKGGMGEVYLAQDTELGRTVALKVLPAEVASDQQRMRRFVQEARAASALNHPNILTIYEVGHTQTTHFIAAEFVAGKTLRQHLAVPPMKLSEALNVAIQTADALSAAHEAGIVHRDIKSENIMLRRDGYVKVLDFGLAKLIEHQAVPVSSEAPTEPRFQTEPGVLMGTLSYMSPEQARGVEVDARTDIWSLGIVLYEMISGRLPFDGATRSDLLVSILSDREPPPLSIYIPEVPRELERIVSKALRKEREERYQVTKDMLLDLKELKQRLEFEAKLERSVQPHRSDEATPQVGQAQAETVLNEPASTAEVTRARATSIFDLVSGSIKLHKLGVTLTLAAIILLTVTSITYRYYFARGIDSIAVLPFANTSNDPNLEYLSDGISEALIDSLTELQQLRVVARATAFHYKGRDVDPQTVGRELNVRAVLMGRVRQIGESLNVHVDLVDASTGAELWGQEYEVTVSGVLSVKHAIAREVTQKLRLRLSGAEQGQLGRHDTQNGEAYQYYLRGRYFWNKRTPEGLRKAIEEFQQTIERDPTYALGYVGLADCYALLEEYADIASSETLPKARAAVDRALQLDDSLAEAHASSASIYLDLWRWAEAEQEFRRAINLNPNYPTAHQWLATYFRTKRQFDDDLREMKRAQELDPLSPIISVNVAWVYILKNDLTSAIDECERDIELDPSVPLAHEVLGSTYLRQRRDIEATSEFEKAVELSGRSGRFLSDLGYCYAVTGRRAEALRIVKELEERYDQRQAMGRYIASVYAGLGERDQAFQWLEKDFQQRSAPLPYYLIWWFSFDDLRSDPRYADLVRRMGLEP